MKAQSQTGAGRLTYNRSRTKPTSGWVHHDPQCSAASGITLSIHCPPWHVPFATLALAVHSPVVGQNAHPCTLTHCRQLGKNGVDALGLPEYSSQGHPTSLFTHVPTFAHATQSSSEHASWISGGMGCKHRRKTTTLQWTPMYRAAVRTQRAEKPGVSSPRTPPPPPHPTPPS